MTAAGPFVPEPPELFERPTRAKGSLHLVLDVVEHVLAGRLPYLDAERAAAAHGLETLAVLPPWLCGERFVGRVNATEEDVAEVLEDLWPDVGIEGPPEVLGPFADGPSGALPRDERRAAAVAAGLARVASGDMRFTGLTKAASSILRGMAQVPVSVEGARVGRWVDGPHGLQWVGGVAFREAPPAPWLERRLMLALWATRAAHWKAGWHEVLTGTVHPYRAMAEWALLSEPAGLVE